jgi:hypothetical protein
VSGFFTTCKRKADTYWGDVLPDSRHTGHAMTRLPSILTRRNSHPHQHRRTRLGFSGSLISGLIGVAAGLRRRVIVNRLGPGLGNVAIAAARAARVALGGAGHGGNERLHAGAAFRAEGGVCHSLFQNRVSYDRQIVC